MHGCELRVRRGFEWRHVGAVVVICALSLGAAGAQPAIASSPARYVVVPLLIPGPSHPAYAVGINSKGDVAGEEGSSRLIPFLYRNGTVKRMWPPTGIAEAQATGLNNKDVVAVEGYSQNGTSEAFAVHPKTHGFQWTRLAIGSIRAQNLTVSGVAANGDIAGGFTIDNPDGSVDLRTVLWRALPGGAYAVAAILPMSRGFNISIPGGVWAQNGVTYVGGAQGNGTVQGASLWSPSPKLTFLPYQLPYIWSIGGKSGQVFGAGTTYSSSNSYAWYGELSFDKSGSASLRSPVILPQLDGYDQAFGEGVAVEAGGKPAVVGEVASYDANLGVLGVLWENNAVFPLESLIGTSHWRITGVAGINQAGEVAAEGFGRGVQQPLILEPR